jgi:hypothetical protein
MVVMLKDSRKRKKTWKGIKKSPCDVPVKGACRESLSGPYTRNR